MFDNREHYTGRPTDRQARRTIAIASSQQPRHTPPAAVSLWSCPDCGRAFANPRQVHTCAPLQDLDGHFTRSDPAVRETFDAVLAAVRALGPVTVLPQRTRIALQVRMSFAALVPRRRWLDGHLVLDRRVDSPRWRRVEEYSPRNVLHAFRLTRPAEVDDELRGWLAAAYRVGRQEHLTRRTGPGSGGPG